MYSNISSFYFTNIVWLLLLTGTPVFQVTAQSNADQLQLKGTRSWIKVIFPEKADAKAYRLYWSANGKQPALPQTIRTAEKTRCYIADVEPEQHYKVWLELVDKYDNIFHYSGDVTTKKNWELDSTELAFVQQHPGSAAIPNGMQLFWHDEFNDDYLNRNKWSTNYYSTIDFLYGNNYRKMLSDSLPQPAFTLNGKTITLFVNDSMPVQLYDKKNKKKISSIQTYDWRKNENLLDNSRGGYFEVRVKRSSSGKPRGLNTAFWFDSPGPDLKYYLEKGTVLNHVEGIRPEGQAFEIDVFEYLNAQFVIHGKVDQSGKFQHNLATHIASGYDHIDKWVTHGMLWTPTSLSHYINGKLIKEYANKHQIYAPNHFMNLLLGAYGGGGSVTMEVDYVRGYQWPLENGNELPNPGFEDSGSLIPWEGEGTLIKDGEQKNNTVVLLKSQQKIAQYVYLNKQSNYEVTYTIKGAGKIQIAVDDAAPVTGKSTNLIQHNDDSDSSFRKNNLVFHSGKAPGNNMKIIRISIQNLGKNQVMLDDITIKKIIR